jgi:hypothetical protein
LVGVGHDLLQPTQSSALDFTALYVLLDGSWLRLRIGIRQDSHEFLSAFTRYPAQQLEDLDVAPDRQNPNRCSLTLRWRAQPLTLGTQIGEEAYVLDQSPGTTLAILSRAGKAGATLDGRVT